MLDRQVTLSTGTLLTLLRRRGVEPHVVLATTPVWEDERARQRADEQAETELARCGLYGRTGLNPGLRAMVDAIARPALEYYGWINGGHDGRPLDYTVLAGSAGDESFVLARNTERDAVVLASPRADELLATFVGQLPRLAAGRGAPLRVPKSQVTQGRRPLDSEPDGFTVLRGASPSVERLEADELRRVLHLPRLGGGSLYVAVRDRTGRRVRVQRPVNYIDTSQGRWLTEEVPGSGEPLIALTPAAPELLADRLRSALGTLLHA